MYQPFMPPNQDIANQMPGGAGATQGFLSQDQAVFMQEAQCRKAICCCCFTHDVFNGVNENHQIREEADDINRFLIYWCVSCLTKQMSYKVNQNGTNTVLELKQEQRFVPLKGRVFDVYQSNAPIGSVGLPGSKVLCSCEQGGEYFLNGIVNLCFLNPYVCCLARNAPMYGGMNLAYDCYGFCFTGCRTHPNLVMDQGESVLYKINSRICQIGYWCGIFCTDDCRTVEMDIKDTANNDIGKIIKYNNAVPQCICCHNHNRFTVQFPIGAGARDRALLFAAALSQYEMYFDF